jgi:hypothetical protein
MTPPKGGGLERPLGSGRRITDWDIGWGWHTGVQAWGEPGRDAGRWLAMMAWDGWSGVAVLVRSWGCIEINRFVNRNLLA